MSSPLSLCIERAFEGTAVIRHAVARVEEVDPQEKLIYDRWIASGAHASMSYMERNRDVRFSPALLLEGARSIICCAIPFPTPASVTGRASEIASYALGRDYHEVVRRHLLTAVERLREALGGEYRVCIDTAPLRERYWAVRSGLGTVGLNGHLFVPGAGSCVFLGEILTTIELPPGRPLPQQACNRCGRCVRACPVGAIGPDGSVDARRCLSYLTIEHRGPFPEGTDLHGRLYGCDICAAVCHLNSPASVRLTVDAELQPRPAVMALTAGEASTLTQERFSAIFSHSAVKRARLDGFLRNALYLTDKTNQSL